MILFSILTNRLNLVYFVFFFVHISTSILTKINAVDSQFYDREEIIQLSMDSIHIVTSTESQIPGQFEMNSDDDEENELLLTLLNSFEIQSKPSTELPNDRISLINTSSSIRLIPSAVHFTEQPIAIPRMQTLILINDHSEPLEIHSFTGLSNEFYSTVLQDIVLSPYGGNMTIHVYYLPRTIGLKKCLATIKTNRGDFSFDIQGIGISNPYGLRPLLNIEIPVNSIYESTIVFHNPFNHSLSINEIYTSDEHLIIELLTNEKIRMRKHSQFYEQWHLKPYETKSIIKINYHASQSNHLYAFICIKTNFSERIILPVQINVSTRFGLYSNVDLLQLNPERAYSSKQTPIYAFNYGLDPVTITDVRVPREYQDYLTVRYHRHAIPPDIHRLNQIADVIVHWDVISPQIQRIHGYIEISTLMKSEESTLRIPFDEEVLHGSLEYEKEETYFFISNENPSNECRSIRIFNQYDIPLVIYNITINKQKLLSKYIEVKYSSKFIHLYSNQWTELLCIILLPQSSSSEFFDSIQTDIDLQTNLSHFSLPIYFYTGFLELDLLNDETNGGIQQNPYEPLELFITSIPINATRMVRFILRNSNPVDIHINQFDLLMSNAEIQLDYIKSLSSDQTTVHIEDFKRLSPMNIPQQHQAVFLLTLHATEPAGVYSQSIKIKTDYQTLLIKMKYQITNGTVELINKIPMQIDVFPNHLSSTDVFLQNQFDEPINITRIHFLNYGFCFSFTWINTSIDSILLQANQTEKIGSIYFDMAPLCKSILPPSESTCYCGLHYHPEFQRQWEESSWLVNTNELDQRLVKKFRNLWEEWTTLVRKQKIQTNIWIYTNRANISWPITINFIWPSVLTQTSINIDFQVTFINTTKIQHVIITNPSFDLVTYSVILRSNASTTNEHIFSISTISKPIASLDNLYNFHLLPNEQITFTVAYRPTSSQQDEAYLIVRNNLTIIESVLLRGEGGIGGLRLDSSQTPIVLDIDANQQNLCPNVDGNIAFEKRLTLENTGNMKTIISEIFFGHSKCSGHGFSVPICTGIVLEPHEKYDLRILFQTNYTFDEVHEILTLNTNIGSMTFPIVVRIPSRVLLACYQTIPRPSWEWRLYLICLCLVILCIALFYLTAVFSAHRSFYDYLRRAVWRYQIEIMNNKIFDLTDLSSAMQNEEKLNTRSNDGTPATDTKKETKHKRTTQAADRSTTVNFKDLSQKTRRARTESDVSKSAKPPIDTSTKALPTLRRLKSDQQTASNPTRLISSSNPSDEETEAAFAFARSKRLSNKRKGSISTTTPIISKPSSDYDPSDLIQLDDSGSDQQWHMVSSSKGHRRGTISRRETPEESHKSDKTPKVSSTEPTKSLLLTSTSHTHNLVSHKPAQSLRQPDPLIHTPFPISVPIRNQRKSYQDNSSLITSNRELAFRQLTEQLWTAGLPSSPTACSMSIRSRRSSAPLSERGGDYDIETIDWDEADLPDSDFGRYASQTEHSMDDIIGTSDRVQTQQKSTTIPPLMSLTITPPPTSSIANPSLSTSVIKENIEPLPFHQHGPGPIQRPNKLSCPLTIQPSTILRDPPRSPDTPDVLVHINHLVDRQNSFAAVLPNSDATLTNSSSMINDMSTTPNVPWTPFSPADWSSKYESSWPSTVQTTNPFAQRQISTDDANFWPESSMNTSWLKFPLPPTSNRQENETPNSFWNLSEASPNSSTSWWPKTTSDENNNNQSRWEFAR